MDVRGGRELGERLSVGSFLRAAPWAALTVLLYALGTVFGGTFVFGFGFAIYESLGGPDPPASVFGAVYYGGLLAVFGGAVIRECRRSIPRSDAWLVDHGRGRLVRRDEVGTLWVLDPGADTSPRTVVEVLDATPRPDGSRERYFLRVPRHVTTPREGVAWTFGFEEASDYLPLVET